MLLNCGVREDSWESLRLQRRSGQLILKEVSPECSLEVLSWSWSSNSLATWCEELTHWKRPWCWERLKAEGEGDDRGWDWMASLTQWIWVWAGSESWWWTGRPGCAAVHGVTKSRTRLSDWTELKVCMKEHVLGLCHRQWQKRRQQVWSALQVVDLPEVMTLIHTSGSLTNF